MCGIIIIWFFKYFVQKILISFRKKNLIRLLRTSRVICMSSKTNKVKYFYNFNKDIYNLYFCTSKNIIINFINKIFNIFIK